MAYQPPHRGTAMRRGASTGNLSLSLIRTQAALQEYESSVSFWLSEGRGRAAYEKARADSLQESLRQREFEAERLGRMLVASQAEVPIRRSPSLRGRRPSSDRRSVDARQVKHPTGHFSSYVKLGAEFAGTPEFGLRGGTLDQSMSTTADGLDMTASLDSPISTRRRELRGSPQASPAAGDSARLALAHAKLQRLGISPPFDLQQWCAANRLGSIADRLAELGVAEAADLTKVVAEDELKGWLTNIEMSRFQRLAQEALQQHEEEELWMEAVRRIRLKALTCCCLLPPAECCCRLAHRIPAQIEKPVEPVVVYPPSRDVWVYILEHGREPPIKTTSETPLALPDGVHQIKVEVHRKLVLDVRVVVSGGAPSPKFLDTKAVLNRLEFIVAGKPSKGAYVTLEMDTGSLTMQTDLDGKIDVLLLPGHYRHTVKHADGSAQINKLEVVGRADFTDPPLSMPTAIMTRYTHNCDHLHLDLDKEPGGVGSMVIMGDVSGSMEGAGIKMLKETFLDVYKKMGKHAADVAFYTWNDHLVTGNGKFKGGDFRAFSAWTASLQAKGGTNFKNAVEQVLALEAQATTVWVLCDGDVKSFSGDGWREFVKAHSGTTFNFAAMGDKAQVDAMQSFAKCARGRFSRGTWS